MVRGEFDQTLAPLVKGLARETPQMLNDKKVKKVVSIALNLEIYILVADKMSPTSSYVHIPVVK